MNLLQSFFQKGATPEAITAVNEHDCIEFQNVVDGANSCFMMTDAELKIVYANDAVLNMLRPVEKQLQESLPNFKVDNIVGQSIDVFHKQPSHQRNILAHLTKPHTTEINVGSLSFKLTIIPVTDKQGHNVGMVVEWIDQTQLLLSKGMLDAMDRSMAVIQFRPDGTIVNANENFLKTTGYSLDEIVGKHHRMFMDEKERTSQEYKQFWHDLAEGKLHSGQYRRISRQGEEIWLQASYNPIFNTAGKVTGVVKYATDITQESLQNADYAGQIEAIGKSQAVIEFDLDGTIRTANENFLKTLGYALDDIQGRHHRMFVEHDYANSDDYRQFWAKLASGKHHVGEYKRIGNNGKVVWIQASYNPILGTNGKPFKVVKYATDITDRKEAIEAVRKTLTALSGGDLTARIDQQFEGEFKILTEAINGFTEELATTISQINQAINTINNASGDIASGNSDLSSRTVEQAASLEETAASLEQLTSTVKLNSENAAQANGLAAEASKIAADGGSVIDRVVDNMSQINESANKISDIIGVIDGIAFQTNILALNAAVEAARAGEQGRGFAVVASEVRSLAQRSAEAAKDIKELISASVTRIESGNELASQSGETMQKVVNSIKRVNDIMAEIAAASAEQSDGINEINRAVAQMDEVTQQNASLVEEAAAAAESLQDQSDQLTERMGKFQLGEDKQVKFERRLKKADHAASKTVSKIIEKAAKVSVKPQSDNAIVESDWGEF